MVVKKAKPLLYIIIIVFTISVILIGVGVTYNYFSSPVDKKDSTIIEIEIPSGSSTKKIGNILKQNNIIKNELFFEIYVKLNSDKTLKASTYRFSPNMSLKEILNDLQTGSTYNPNEIRVTFKEGINMREIARVISNNTNNSYDSVIEKSNDLVYLESLKTKYWFITDQTKQAAIYYKLEGYLFPDTYNFADKNVTVEDIFNKMLDEMTKVLEPYKQDILNSNLSVHEVITLASMVEKEGANDTDKARIASVFLNRIKSGISLGSDVTTRYALKIDNPKRALSAKEYAISSPYNTRLTNGTMNGKLPIGPICTVSLSSLKASIYPESTDYLFFIANIKTKETFFYKYSSDFEKKKAELQQVNEGF